MPNLSLPFISAICGVSFHADAVAQARVGDAALIEHDPANEYDANACRVTVRGELVGHLPRLLAARLVSSGDTAWTGTVSEVITGNHPTALRVQVLAPCLPTPAPAPVPDTADSEPMPVVPVSSRSGRSLGVAVGQTATHVLVDTGTRVVPYPRDLVLMES